MSILNLVSFNFESSRSFFENELHKDHKLFLRKMTNFVFTSICSAKFRCVINYLLLFYYSFWLQALCAFQSRELSLILFLIKKREANRWQITLWLKTLFGWIYRWVWFQLIKNIQYRFQYSVCIKFPNVSKEVNKVYFFYIFFLYLFARIVWYFRFFLNTAVLLLLNKYLQREIHGIQVFQTQNIVEITSNANRLMNIRAC